ncbi:MAG TPA: pyridoxal-dependent decarboxylase [Pyrinomonadaceae bacterium]|jgi:glutamate/tyrosine decarboxylase-like PLP-dependent enzyme
MTSSAAKQLRTQSALDVSNDELHQIADLSTRLVLDYFNQVSERDVVARNYQEKRGSLPKIDLAWDPVPLDQLIEECQTIFDLSRHNGHPRFFGYVASPSTAIGAYADLVTSALNANVTCWRSAPGGTEVEKLVVRWLGELIGYSKTAHGLLTSGGSMANLTALLIASRRQLGKEIARTGLWNSGTPITIYTSDEVHMSIPKAADILGFGRDYVRMISCDDRARMNVRELRERIQTDLTNGLRPFCIVASAGTVNTGAVDPLKEIAAVAREFDLWLHVDGAYGAPAALDVRKKYLFTGLELADSVSLDPHKWLYVPVDAGCLLFRDEATARAAFNTDEADYIKVHGLSGDETFAFWDFGIELSRRFRALKVGLTLRYYGARRIAEAISGDIALAEYMAQLVEEADDFELLSPVELSICCFRYRPSGVDDEVELDRLNEQILPIVQKSGQAYVSNATVNGHFALRACITNFRTTKADIELTVEVIREAGRQAVSTTSR